MDAKTLNKANELQEEIRKLERFIIDCENNRSITLFQKKIKKKNLVVTVADYMRETKLYELSPKLRQKFIETLKNELFELKAEFAKIS